MKAVKLNLIIFFLAMTAGMSFAGNNESRALIHQLNEDMISVKAEICDLDKMRVEITNEDGEIVFEDHLSSDNRGIAAKTYDFSETRVGEYFITVFCNDKVLRTTVIADNQVEQRDNHYFVLN